MRKLLLLFILAAACISSAWATVYEAHVYNAKELSDALHKYTKDEVHISLKADIDMAEVPDFKPASSLTGSISGYYEHTDSVSGKTDTINHVIKNLKTSLVEDMTNAKVSGIMIQDGQRGGYWRNNACFICEDAVNCDFTDIILVNCHYKDSDFGGDFWANKTGLLANTMDHCNVTNVSIMASSLTSDGSEVGGITGVATNGCKFSCCMVDSYSNFYTSWDPNAYIGGIVGTSEDCSFEGCLNMATVSASHMSDNLGGITGRSTKCHFTGCINQGTVTQLSAVSFGALCKESLSLYTTHLAYYSAFAFHHIHKVACNSFWIRGNGPVNWHKGQSDILKNYGRDYMPKSRAEYNSWHKDWMAERTSYGWYAKVMSAIAIAMAVYEVAQWIYHQNAPDEVGGISAAAYGCTFDQCINEGLLICRDAYCGGIVGYADTKDGTITNINTCINTGYVQGGEQTGGIVGYLKDSHATHCLNAGSVDCLKDTKGPIYGDTNAQGATITTCFDMVHGVKYEGGAIGGEGVIVKFGEEDILGGLAAYEINRMVGKNIFGQTVGEDYFPNFMGAEVKESDIRTDIDLTYHVNDASSFCAVLMHPYAMIELENDIDFKQQYISLYRGCFKFHGSIDGKGHSIKNVKLDIEDHSNENFDQDNERHAMIGFAEGATFKNLTLDSLSVKHGIMLAGLVGNSKNSTYEDIKITNSEIYAYNSFVGGLVYESDHDTFTRCTTDPKTSVSTHNIPMKTHYAYAGGLVSKAKGSTFTDCVNGADVAARLDVAGGLVSWCENSTFTRCSNEGYIHHNSSVISDNDELGGIAGEAYKSTFNECFNRGKIYCEDENGGGIVGYGEEVTINNCLNASEELKFSENTCGGIIGKAVKSLVTNCVSGADYPMIGKESDMNSASGNNYRLEKNNHTFSNWEMGVSAQTLGSGIVAYWLNNGSENRKEGRTVWYQITDGIFAEKVPYPTTENLIHPEVEFSDLHPTIIRTADDLVQFAKRVNEGNQFACAVLANDIDLSSIDWWQPIGTEKNRFRGIFDGQGHTISGMKVYINSGSEGAGLFGVAHANAEIRNVILADNCKVHNAGDGGAAGILGRIVIGWHWGNVFIENCGSYAQVSAPKHAGAVLGRMTTSDHDRNVKVYINKCFNMGDIYASAGNSALLVGYAKNNGYITNSWSGSQLEKMNENCPYPYDSKNPTGEMEYFAGYEKNLYMANCYAIYKPGGPITQQKGVQHLSNPNALTSGELTYKLNGNATEGDLDWYQKIGEDAHPMFATRGGDIVYMYLSDNKNAYTNDLEMSEFRYYGPLRVKNDYSVALLDGESDRSLKLTKYITVDRAELNRAFKANVPSTLVLPFDAKISSESRAKYFTFDAMNYDEENDKYTAVMKEVKGGQLIAYKPYLALFAEETEGLTFEDVTIEPVEPVVTQQDEWYFIGSTNYKVIDLKEEESDYYYGYAGMEFDGYKLGEFSRLGEGASIAPFRCYMRHIASDDAPDSFDVITKAPTRAGMESGNVVGYNPGTISMPKQFDVILKSANGETGIATFDNETGEMTFQGWYDLNGNRVDENYSGVRVGEGKKVIVK